MIGTICRISLKLIRMTTIAMATIKNILSKDPQALEFTGLIPVDTREYNKNLLGELKNNVDLHMNPGMTEMGFNTG